jgi:hypothetical protein
VAVVVAAEHICTTSLLVRFFWLLEPEVVQVTTPLQLSHMDKQQHQELQD